MSNIVHFPKDFPMVEMFYLAAKHGMKVVYEQGVYRLETRYLISGEPPGDEYYGPEYDEWQSRLPPANYETQSF